jgi:hypothetical protein
VPGTEEVQGAASTRRRLSRVGTRPQSPVVFTVTPHQLNIFLGGYMRNRMKQLPTIQVGSS